MYDFDFIIEFKMGRLLIYQKSILPTIIILLCLVVRIETGLNGLTVSPTTINSIATYTWSISLSTTSYSPLTLAFSPYVTVLPNCTVTVNGVTATFSQSGNTLIISSISTSILTIVVSNVQNPSSAVSTYAFNYTTPGDGTISLSVQGQPQYQIGTLSSCPWSFSLCTEQSSSDLYISFTTINRIPSGSNSFYIGYATIWTNHLVKGLVYGVSTLSSCSYIINSVTYIGSCQIDLGNTQIIVGFTTLGIASGTAITVKIGGVNSPPTKQTPSSNSYYIYTVDGSQNKIDGLTNCVINNVCVTNQTTGTFSNLTMNVNANYGNPSLVFPNTLTITIQPSDTIEVYYTPFASLTSCSILSLYRSSSRVYNLSPPTSNTNYITFTYPSSSGSNTDYSSPFNIYLQCSAFLLPPSETPTTLAFYFKRSANEYLELTTPVTATATTFNSSKGMLSLSTTSMAATSILTFNFLNGQGLGSNPAIKLTIPTDFIIASPICAISILGLSVSNSSCTINSNVITIITTASSSISSNSNITITIQGATNPSVPKSYSFPMTTYYDSTVSSSRVQNSLTAFTTTITQIVNYPVTLSPSSLTVYSSASIVLSFTPTITLPSLSTFYIQFPTGVTNILPNSNLLAVGGLSKPLNGTISSNATSNSFTFVSGVEIAIGSAVTITIPITTPGNMGTYSFVKLIVSNNQVNYLSSKSSLFLNVNQVNTMSVSVSPVTSVAGATTNYNLVIYLTIPHNTSFIVQVDVPTDTRFISSNATCTNCNATSLSPANSTTFSFIASNPNGYSTQTISFVLSSFVNPRYVGTSQYWGISTKTVSPSNLISYSITNATINSPNSLTAVLSKSDAYYINNTSPVKMTFTFTNQLASGDYITLSTTSNVYSATAVNCSSLYGTCALGNGSTSNVTVIKITPNITSIINNTLYVIVEGLTSGSSSSYTSTYNIDVITQTSNNSHMDSGTMIYNVSCGDHSSNQCKRCYNNGTCIDCYLSIGQYLQGNVCVGACGPPTSYNSYADNSTGTCTACINNCLTCSNSTICLTCITNYSLYTTDSTCKMICQTTSGYYQYTVTGTSNLRCSLCITNCLQCINGSNSCTRCNNQSVLINGVCSSGCGSTNYYQLNGQCFVCHASCYNCSGAGSGSCYTCSANYHRYLTLCVATCPTGTAVNPATGDCGCDTKCLTCSTYTSCTACLNASEWVMNGACISSCPVGTYADAGQCNSCSSGCMNCTINTCTTCINGSYLFNNSCYSDCNLISNQYDSIGTTCVLCPSGCDRCSSTNCTACLSDYTLSSNQCIKTCLLSNTCSTSDQTLPLPGFLSLVIWVGISAVIHFIYHKNYLPYSVILLTGIIQFVLILGLIASVGSSSSSRLLVASYQYISQMKALLGAAIALNYLENITYLILFICYIKPLVTNPRQIDVISNVVVLIIAFLTNFRFGLIAFSRMFPKPNIYVQNPSKLTPIHYLCIVCLFLDVLSLAACGLGIFNSQKLSNTFMLSIDLLIVIIINFAITIWFVAGSKPEKYYDDFVKKYHIQDNAHNPTDQTLPNEKNVSKANMIANESFNFDDLDHTDNDDGSYKKLTRLQNKQSNDEETINNNPHPVTISSKAKDFGDPDPFLDPNFETNIKSKQSGKSKDNSMVISKIDFGKGIDKEGKSVDDNLSVKKGNSISHNFSKGTIKSDRKRIQPQKDIIQVEQSDYPDLEEQSSKDHNVFNANKQKVAKPKRLKQSKTLNKSIEEPMKVMKKGDKKIGYFQSDAYDSNIDGQDLQEIIKQKIWQSTIKLQKPSIQSFRDSNDQTGHEEISPSWFNIQNQRLDITDLEQSDPQQ